MHDSGPARPGVPGAPPGDGSRHDFLRQFAADLRHPYAEVVAALTRGLAARPDAWARMQREMAAAHARLWEQCTGRAAPATTAADPVAAEAPVRDRRFAARAWRAHPYFDWLHRAYLLNVGWLDRAIELAALEPAMHRKARFFLHQLADAMAPSNFPSTNPEALQLAIESGGDSLARGMRRFAADLERGWLTMTDESAFEVGRDLALTPGAVVHENRLFQLLRYRPAGASVRERPLLVVPPFINKYYILDLQPENSFVRYALELGLDVFLVSWRSADARTASATWDDYVREALWPAIAIARELSGADRVNTLGFCVGGTLLATALAAAAARGEQPAASLTLLATMLDFHDTGDIGVYVDPAYVAARERELASGGIVNGRELASTFASLRANELVWNNVVNLYLKGRDPDAFDLLYWNSDGANLPGPLYAWYVRNMYLENNLRVPGRLRVCDAPLDLRSITAPAYLLATREDHIVPWQSAYASARLLGGRREFVLGASGHIAGVINPPAQKRRHYWINPKRPRAAEDWLAGASRQDGSWWPHWGRWLLRHAGRPRPAPARLGSDARPELEPAPGRYVRARIA